MWRVGIASIAIGWVALLLGSGYSNYQLGNRYKKIYSEYKEILAMNTDTVNCCEGLIMELKALHAISESLDEY